MAKLPIMQRCSAFTFTAGVASAQLMPMRSFGLVRTQIVITNVSASNTITLTKGDVVAVANQGIVLLPYMSYIESSDGGYTCWQGPMQCVASAATTSVSVVEAFERPE